MDKRYPILTRCHLYVFNTKGNLKLTGFPSRAKEYFPGKCFLLPRLMYRKEQKEEVFSVKADFSPFTVMRFCFEFCSCFQTWKFDTAFQTTDVSKKGTLNP